MPSSDISNNCTARTTDPKDTHSTKSKNEYPHSKTKHQLYVAVHLTSGKFIKFKCECGIVNSHHRLSGNGCKLEAEILAIPVCLGSSLDSVDAAPSAPSKNIKSLELGQENQCRQFEKLTLEGVNLRLP